MFIQIAPMEGVVDFQVRKLLTKIGGIDRTVTEFIRVTNQLHPPKVFYKYAPELQTKSRTTSGTPVFIQLLGSDPQVLLENAHLALELGAQGVDLNFGCPAKTVNRHDGGATLLKNPERIFNVVSKLKSSLPIGYPVTAKVRLGFSDKDLHKDIAQAVDSGGADQLVIHARTRNEGYRPPAHWEFIGFMKDVVKRVPVIANGDIWSLEDYKRCVEVSGVQDVALGRSLVSRPDLALILRAYHSKESYTPLTWNEIFEAYLYPLFESYMEQSMALAAGRLKQALKALFRNYPEAGALFNHIRRETCGKMIQRELLNFHPLTSKDLPTNL